MIARVRERDPALGEHRGDLLRPIEDRGLLIRERQVVRLEPASEGSKRRGALAGLGGEDPEVVHPSQGPDARRSKHLVGSGQHRIRQDGRWLGPDGKAGDAGLVECLEQGGHSPHVARRAPQSMEGPADEVGTDRWIAQADVGGGERARPHGEAAASKQESHSRLPPRLQSHGGRRPEGHGPIGHDLLAERGLDRRSDRGDHGRVSSGGGTVEDRQPPDAASALRCRDQHGPWSKRSIRRHLSPPLGPGEERPRRCGIGLYPARAAARNGPPGGIWLTRRCRSL
jgi:hypothetical protein